MSQQFPVNDLKWVEDISEFDESFVKCYNEERDEGYFIEVGVDYLENLNYIHYDLPFLPKRMKVEKVEKIVANLGGKEKYVIKFEKSLLGVIKCLAKTIYLYEY